MRNGIQIRSGDAEGGNTEVTAGQVGLAGSAKTGDVNERQQQQEAGERECKMEPRKKVGDVTDTLSSCDYQCQIYCGYLAWL